MKELNHLRAAVACHPHALARLLEEAYAQRGPMRYQLIQVRWHTVRLGILTPRTSSISQQHPALPTCLERKSISWARPGLISLHHYIRYVPLPYRRKTSLPLLGRMSLPTLESGRLSKLGIESGNK